MFHSFPVRAICFSVAGVYACISSVNKFPLTANGKFHRNVMSWNGHETRLSSVRGKSGVFTVNGPSQFPLRSGSLKLWRTEPLLLDSKAESNGFYVNNLVVIFWLQVISTEWHRISHTIKLISLQFLICARGRACWCPFPERLFSFL